MVADQWLWFARVRLARLRQAHKRQRWLLQAGACMVLNY